MQGKPQAGHNEETAETLRAPRRIACAHRSGSRPEEPPRQSRTLSAARRQAEAPPAGKRRSRRGDSRNERSPHVLQARKPAPPGSSACPRPVRCFAGYSETTARASRPGGGCRSREARFRRPPVRASALLPQPGRFERFDQSGPAGRSRKPASGVCSCSWPCGQQFWLKSGCTPTRDRRDEVTHSEANGIDCGASLLWARGQTQTDRRRRP